MFSEKPELPRLNGLVVTYTILVLFAVILDYFALAKYYIVKQSNIFNLELPLAKQVYITLVIFLSMGLLIVLSTTVLKNYKKMFDFVYFPKINSSDWGVIILFLAITFLRLPFPDQSFDVVNYHIFLQGFKFENAITYHFFPAGIAGFSFPLGDRLFYIFRLLLGYRGGVLLNTLVLILLFFQVKDLIILNPNMKMISKHNGLLLSLSALFALSTEHIFANIGVYMVDLLFLPFLLEMFRLAVGRTLPPTFALVYGSLMFGLSFSLKLTSVMFSVLLFSIILCKYYRQISFKTTIISSLVFIFPFVCYMTYNFTQTNNPVYPYLNEIFGSPFFQPAGFITANFPLGPKSALEFLGWPFYIIFQPQRTSELWYNSGRLGLGLLVAFVYTGLGLLRRKSDQVTLGLFVLVSMYLWVFAKGLIRYGSFLEIISSVLIVDFLCILFNSDRVLFNAIAKAFRVLIMRYGYPRRGFQIQPRLITSVFKLGFKIILVKSLMVITMVAVLTSSLYTFYFSTLTNLADWSQRGPAYLDPKNYLKNIELIGKDYLPLEYDGNEELKDIVDEIDVWVIYEDRAITGYCKLLKSDIPILSIGFTGLSEESNNAYLNLEKSINLREKNIYMLSVKGLSRALLEAEADQHGFKIIAVYEIQPTFTFFPIQLIKVALK